MVATKYFTGSLFIFYSFRHYCWRYQFKILEYIIWGTSIPIYLDDLNGRSFDIYILLSASF